MFEGKAIIGETDMPMRMQQHAMCYAAQALAMIESSDCQQIARSLKQEFDKCYGGGWQCIVGTNFGSFVTHSHGNFIYFCIEKLAFLLFKGIPVCAYS
ncbi:hypothetical protein KP509_1Z040100 [Ceratopteris richardii]|nr:hypothetical protein KP509_1Z040100 [Ceratopteris richardii]